MSREDILGEDMYAWRYPFSYPCPYAGCRWFVQVRDTLEGRMALAKHVRDVHASNEQPPKEEEA